MVYFEHALYNLSNTICDLNHVQSLHSHWVRRLHVNYGRAICFRHPMEISLILIEDIHTGQNLVLHVDLPQGKVQSMAERPYNVQTQSPELLRRRKAFSTEILQL